MHTALKNKTTLVTGVSSGIGREIAQHLAAHGARVIGTVRDPKTCVADSSFRPLCAGGFSQRENRCLLAADASALQAREGVGRWLKDRPGAFVCMDGLVELESLHLCKS